MYSIYALKDPRDNTIRYIGLSKDPYQRFGMHISNISKATLPKDKWILELKHAGVFPILDIIETDIPDAYGRQKEDYWIKKYVDDGYLLTNALVPSNTVINPEPYPIQPSEWRTMDEQDIVSFLKRHGWTYTRRARGMNGRFYVYAQRREDTGITERYIAPLSKVHMLTSEQIIKKLEQSSSKTQKAVSLQPLQNLRLTA